MKDKNQYHKIEIKTMVGRYRYRIRPLTIDELQELLILARDTGWYGNHELLSYVLEWGLSNDNADIEEAESNIFVTCNTARQIWILTLRNLAKTVNALSKLVKDGHAPLNISSYKFTDLATPGLLWYITKDMRNVNVEGYAHALLNRMAVKLRFGDEIVSEKEKEEFVEKHFNSLWPWFLSGNAIDDNIDRFLPSSVLQTTPEKVYAILQIARTLDWRQYFKVLFRYNTIIKKLTFYSNQLGGLDTCEPETVLLTGIPHFIQIVSPLKSLPVEVLSALVHDICVKDLNYLSQKNQNRLHGYFTEALNETMQKNSAIIDDLHVVEDGALQKILEQEEVANVVMDAILCFNLKVSSHSKVISEICFAHWDEFSESVHRRVAALVKEARDNFAFLNIPDCYLLVEGVSDEICYSKFLQILNKTDAFVKIINCGSKSGVYSKYRDLIANESYIGSIVIALDDDALDEERDIKRKLPDDIAVSCYRYEKGTLEDLFPTELHIKCINSLYPEGESVTCKDLEGESRIERAIKKILWRRNKAELDKKAYAGMLAEIIQSEKDIPKVAIEIIKESIQLAQLRMVQKPRTSSILSIDRRTKQMCEEAFFVYKQQC